MCCADPSSDGMGRVRSHDSVQRSRAAAGQAAGVTRTVGPPRRRAAPGRAGYRRKVSISEVISNFPKFRRIPARPDLVPDNVKVLPVIQRPCHT
eukprot:532742-Hanusia_phi.AAC.1